MCRVRATRHAWRHDRTAYPRDLHPRPVDPLRRLATLGRPVWRGRLHRDGARLARRFGQRGNDTEERGCRRGQGYRRHHQRLPRRHQPPAGQADRDRPLVRRPHRAEAAVRGRGRRGDRDRPRPDQGGQAAAVRPDPLRAPGAVQARQQEASGNAHEEAVPLRLRQRAHQGRIRRAVRQVGDPRTGQAALRGLGRELQEGVPGCRRYQEGGPRTSADRRRRQGPHRAGGGGPGRLQALLRLRCGYQLSRLPRSLSTD